MTSISISAAAVLIGSLFFAAIPAAAVDGQVLITQAKVLAGNVTPGDAAGYPVTLSLGGSYVLGSNLTPGPGVDGIVAAAPDISIDLNGFKISGGPAGGINNARYGILDQADRLTVKNGTIGAFKSAGIYAANRPYLIVENTRIINGRGLGINAGGADLARIQNNTIATNVGAGIFCGRSCHIEGNVISFNGVGIRTGLATVLGNTITFNESYGIRQEGTSDQVVAIGNNTILQNNNLNSQIFGSHFELHPNYCEPAC